MTIVDRRADKTTNRVRTEQERKLTRLQHKNKKRPKTDKNWVRNISSCRPKTDENWVRNISSCRPKTDENWVRNISSCRPKTDENWVRNISSCPLDKTETRVLSYGLKHSVTPKRIPTESIVSSVEAVLSHQQDLSESAKDNIRSRIASTVQSASIPDNNLTKDEQQALQRHCYTTSQQRTCDCCYGQN